MVEMKITTITPEIAATILEKNKDIKRRKIKKFKVEYYAEEMKEGRWELNGDSIKFDGDSKLLDGQHRLSACIKAGVPFNTLMVYGLSKTSAITIDTGAKRGFYDVLYIDSYKNSHNLSTIIRYLYLYDTGELKKPKLLRKTSNYRLLKEHYETKYDDAQIQEDIKFITQMYMKSRILTPTIGCFVYIIFKRISEFHAKEFMRQLYMGINLEANNPILLLREKLFALKASKAEWHISNKINVLFQIWNAYRSKKEMKRIVPKPIFEDLI